MENKNRWLSENRCMETFCKHSEVCIISDNNATPITPEALTNGIGLFTPVVDTAFEFSNYNNNGHKFVLRLRCMAFEEDTVERIRARLPFSKRLAKALKNSRS